MTDGHVLNILRGRTREHLLPESVFGQKRRNMHLRKTNSFGASSLCSESKMKSYEMIQCH